MVGIVTTVTIGVGMLSVFFLKSVSAAFCKLTLKIKITAWTVFKEMGDKFYITALKDRLLTLNKAKKLRKITLRFQEHRPMFGIDVRM